MLVVEREAFSKFLMRGVGPKKVGGFDEAGLIA